MQFIDEIQNRLLLFRVKAVGNQDISGVGTLIALMWLGLFHDCKICKAHLLILLQDQALRLRTALLCLTFLPTLRL
jgi:hypothetical protein